MTVRVAVVGAGWVSLNRHLPALQAHPDVEVVGLIAPEVAMARADGPALKKMKNLGHDLDAPWMSDVDAVMIGTPPDTHHDVVMAALDHGLHVLVEKPFASNVKQADAMIKKAAKLDRRLAVVHNLQFCNSATTARARLERGDIGPLRGVVGLQSSNHRRRLPTWYKELPLGLFTDESPHLIYLVQSFLGGAELEAMNVGLPLAPDDNTPDVVSIGFRGDAQQPGSLLMNFGGAISEWGFILLGDKATLAIDLFRDVLVTLPNDNVHVTKDVMRTSAASVGGHLMGVAKSGFKRVTKKLDYGNGEVVRRFIAAIEHGADLGPISAESGRGVVAVIEAAHAKAR